jgi:putative tryptophan/tyrosine transport system substrate-binding protein
MRRREFMAGLAGAAVWTATARAQQLPVVGYFQPGTPTGSVSDQTAAFRKGLAEVGFVEGRNVTVEYRYGNNDSDRITELLGDLVRRRLNVLVVISAGAALAAKAITTTVPIVFLTAVDPVQLGLVASFSRPGGNLTGISVLTGELGAKRLQLMHEMLPAAARFALLVSSLDGQVAQIAAREMQAAAASIGRDLDTIAVGSNDEINTVFASIVENRVEAVLITPGTLFLNRRVHLSTIAARHRIPVIFPDRQYAEAGGLMSYGPNVQDQYRQMGLYAGRILKGEKPADLPVVQPAKFELVINLATAKVIGLTISPSLLAIADEVIE